MRFCERFDLTPLPVEETCLLRFVAFLFQESLCHQTIRSYLCAVRHLQISQSMPDPSLASMPRLTYALKGVQRETPICQRRRRLPITPEHLQRIYQVWAQGSPDRDKLMLWAAFCLGFFGFMRSGEFTCPSVDAFTPDMLSADDVAVDSRERPSHITVHLKRSKNDPFGVSTTVHLGATGSPLCPVVAMLAYLACRPATSGPLFVYGDGTTLSRSRLVQSLRQALNAAGISDANFSGHSFRIGAATAAARAGLSDSQIQTLGRWRSAAFTRYIRTPWQDLAASSALLAPMHMASHAQSPSRSS